MNKKFFLIGAALLLSLLAAAQDIRVVEVRSGSRVDIPEGARLVASAPAKKQNDMPPSADAIDAPQYECIYAYTIHAAVEENYSTILQIGEKMSKFGDYSAYTADSIAIVPGADPEEVKKMEERRRKMMFYFDTDIYQDFPEGAMTVVQEVVPNMMSYEEPMGALEWTIDDSATETICGYACQKASARYGGKEWTVWFAPEIASTSGPWKLNGLPGLILAAKDSEGLHEFRAIAFRRATTPLLKRKDITIHKSTRAKVLEAKLKIEKEGMNGIDTNMITSISVIKTSDTSANIYFNEGVPIRTHPNGYQSLETE